VANPPSAHQEPGLGKRRAQQVEEAGQRAARPARRRRVAGAQDRGAQVLFDLVVERHKGEQREIAPVPVQVDDVELARVE